MRNLWTIARREYNQYFISPLAYAVAFLNLLAVGLIFAINIVSYSDPRSFGLAPDARMVTGPLAFLLVISTPALTMRLIADEHRMGTMELLLTSPVRDWELVAGKWLGAFLFILTLFAITLVFPLILNILVSPGIDLLKTASGYLGLILLAGALIAIGVAASSLFTNQFAAFFATIGIFIVMWWLIGAPANFLQSGGEVFRYLDMSSHFYDSLNEGIINLSDIVYYLSLTATGLLVGSTAVEMRRWG